MNLNKYRNTPLGSIALSDSITGLLACRVITPDMAAAAELAPMRFDPMKDAEFYRDIYWGVPEEQQRAAAEKIITRFVSWYKTRANPMNRVYLTISALTESYDSLDITIEDVQSAFLTRNKIQMVDSDDTIFYVVDYEKAKIPDTVVISQLLDTERIRWWRDHFEAQARRVLATPKVEYAKFTAWNNQYIDYCNTISDEFRSNPFIRAGLSIRQGRKIIRRSLRLFSSFFGEGVARQFIHGRPIRIRGHIFEWELQLQPRNLCTYTVMPPSSHVPYQLSVNDLNGNRLAEGCVLFEDTSVLDQAVAIGISVSHAEEELELIHTANFFKLTDLGRAHEHLQTAVPRRPGVPFDYPPDVRYLRHIDNLQRVDQELDRQTDRMTALVEASNRAADRHADDFNEERRQQAALDFDRLQAEGVDRIEPEQFVENVQVAGIIGEQNGVAVVEPPPPPIDQNLLSDALQEAMQAAAEQRAMLYADPLLSVIRQELYRKLDVRPDLLEYMAKPERQYGYLKRTLRPRTPRLEAFIEHGTPFDQREE